MNFRSFPLFIAVAFLGCLFVVAAFFGPKSKEIEQDKDKNPDLTARDSDAKSSAEGFLSVLPSALLKKNAETPQIFGINGPVTMDQIPRSDLRRELLSLNVTDREFALRKLGESKVPVADVFSLHVSQGGHLYYACKMLATDPVPLPPEASAPS